jgi:hypothetical protein
MIVPLDDIDSLELFIENIGSKSKYLVQEISGDIYHYTDLDGLKGIIEKHDLWLTNS